MANLEADSIAPENVESVPQNKQEVPRKFWRKGARFVLFGVVVVLVVLYAAASRYQPLTIIPGGSTSGPLSSSNEATTSLLTTFSNTGPMGVSILALHPKVYADPPVVVGPPLPCFRYVGSVRWCGQKKNGFFAGNRFHPFALTGDNTIPVAWQYSFSCRALTGGSSISGPVEVRVTYRFGWFTHSILMAVANVPTSGGPVCTNQG